MAEINQNPNAPVPTPSQATPTASLATERLLNDESVSSQFTNLESILSKAAGATEAGKTAVEAGKTASEASILGSYGREIDVARETGAARLASATEAQRGFATSTAALDRITKDTAKTVNDLEQRKQELLLQNNAAAASKIADIQMQAIQFEQDAKQKIFSNLLSLSSLGFQKEESARAERTLRMQERSQSFQERSAINSIALQFGVAPTEGDTLESIVAKVAPFASEKQKLELAKTRAEINKANAEASKAQQGLDFSLDDATVGSLASTINNLLMAGDSLSVTSAQSILGNITEKKGAQGLAKVQAEASKLRDSMFSPEALDNQIISDIGKEKLKSDILAKYEALKDKGIMTPTQFEKAEEILNKKYPKVGFRDAVGNLVANPVFGPLLSAQYPIETAIIKSSQKKK